MKIYNITYDWTYLDYEIPCIINCWNGNGTLGQKVIYTNKEMTFIRNWKLENKDGFLRQNVKI